MDITSIVGLICGIGGILLGQVLEGGHIGSIMQLTAGLIVCGGTVGATLVSSPMADVKTALSLIKMAFLNVGSANPEKVAEEIIGAAQRARKESILVLEKEIGTYSHPFMNTVFRHVVDGYDSKAIREVGEIQILLEEEHLQAGAKLFVDAGGFSPTIGIIGAVLGLIHVMENLADTSKLGAGIAVAFVATVYGVGLANLILIPMGNKLKRKIKMNSQIQEMILQGGLGIVEGLNPHIIEEQLMAYLSGHGGHAKKAGEEGGDGEKKAA